MKKIIMVMLVVAVLAVFPTVTWGMTTPSVSRNHGVVTCKFVSDTGLFLGAEYGITPNLAIGGELGASSEWTRIGLKYQAGSNLAVVGGIMGSEVFFGLNGSGALGKALLGLYEVDLMMANSSLNLVYQAGVRYNINKTIDLRGGLFGATNGSANTLMLQIGVGYKF